MNSNNTVTTLQKTELQVADLYQLLQIREFNLTQFAAEKEITDNTIGLLDYLRTLLEECNFKSKWHWLNLVMKYYTAPQLFNLIMDCQSIAEFADRIEFDGQINAEFKQLYANDECLSEIILQDAKYLILLIQILIDPDLSFSAAYFRVGIYNQIPFASYELIDDNDEFADGENYATFLQRAIEIANNNSEKNYVLL